MRNALIRSGHTPAEAYQITWGAIRRWAHGGGKAHPEVVAAAQAALADLAAKSAIAHAHANETGGAMALSWNNVDGIGLATVDLGGYLPPHVPAGSPTGGQFGTTSGSPSAAKAGKAAKPGAKAKAADPARAAGLAKRAALHAQANALRAKAKTVQGQIAALNATIALQVKATAAAKAKPAASAAAKAKAAIAKAATKKAATTAKKTTTAKKPNLAANRASVASLKVQVSSLLSRASALDAQAAAIKLAGGDGGRFLELAAADLLGRVPPGRPEGGQFVAAEPRLTRHDTPEMAARAVNAMETAQRAMVRASILVPPGFTWGPGDRLAVAQ